MRTLCPHCHAEESRCPEQLPACRERAAGPIAALRDRSAEVERERDLFRGHLLRMLQRGGVSSHSHAVPGMWDVSNGFPRGGTPCAQCHDDADAREAVGLPRWPGAGARNATTFTEWPMPAHDVVRLVDAIDSAEGTIAELRERLAEVERDRDAARREGAEAMREACLAACRAALRTPADIAIIGRVAERVRDLQLSLDAAGEGGE